MSLLSKLFNREEEDTEKGDEIPGEATNAEVTIPDAPAMAPADGSSSTAEPGTKQIVVEDTSPGSEAKPKPEASKEARSDATMQFGRSTMAGAAPAKPVGAASMASSSGARRDPTTPFEKSSGKARPTTSVGIGKPPPLPLKSSAARTSRSSLTGTAPRTSSPGSSPSASSAKSGSTAGTTSSSTDSKSGSASSSTTQSSPGSTSAQTSSSSTGSAKSAGGPPPLKRSSAAKPAFAAKSTLLGRPSSPSKAAVTAGKPAESNSDDADLDAALDAALTPGDGVPLGAEVESSEAPLEDAKETFLGLGATQLRPVLDTMMQLQAGRATAAWLDACVSPLQQLRSMAKELKIEPLASDITRVLDRLTQVRNKHPNVSDTHRDALIDAYCKMIRAFPNAQEPGAEWDRRQPIIVSALLLQVRGAGSVTMGKLFAAGLNGLATLTKASGDEIASTSGIDRELADRIASVFKSYDDTYNGDVSGHDRETELEQLRALLTQLREHQVRYAEARDRWSDNDLRQRKAARADRATTLLQIHVLLARLGELERLGALESMPFSAKIHEIERFLNLASEQRART